MCSIVIVTAGGGGGGGMPVNDAISTEDVIYGDKKPLVCQSIYDKALFPRLDSIRWS